MHKGRVVFGDMDEVVFGVPAAEAIVAQMDRLGATRALLMVSGTLNRATDEIAKVRSALGDALRGSVRQDAARIRRARRSSMRRSRPARNAADLIVTIGGGSITDGAKAVQLCLANDIRTAEDINGVPGHAAASAPPLKPPTVRQISVPTTICRRRVQRHRRRHQRAHAR